MTSGTPCHACGAEISDIFYRQAAVPLQSNLLLTSHDAALSFPTGELTLGVCHACGFIENVAFEPGLLEYSASYEESQACSPRFLQYAEELCRDLAARYDLAGRHVLEVGCGKGDFLALLTEVANCTGTGIDPALAPERIDPATAARLTLIQDWYDRRHAELNADLIVCRHTLEHVQDVRGFLTTLRANIGDRRTPVLFELPDSARILREAAFWDVYYEHCAYFTAGSLARLFAACGFQVTDLDLVYDGQYLLLHALPADVPATALEPDSPASVVALAQDFRRAVAEQSDVWRRRMDGLRAAGKRAVLWGSGSKAVGYLTTLGLAGEIAEVVDINPRKQGQFLAGTGHPIVAPERLREQPPDLVIVMNPIYRDEIAADLVRLGVHAELVTV